MFHNPKYNWSAGFTLVEMLAAIAGASLLLMAVSFAINRLSLDWQQAHKANLTMRANKAGDTLRALIAQSVPADADPEGVAFEGDEDGFSIRILAPLAISQEGLLQMNVSRRQREAGAAVAIKFTPEQDRLVYGAVSRFPSEQILLEGLGEVVFEYIGEHGAVTSRNWPPGPLLPKAVKITLVPKNREETPIVIWATPKFNVDGRCLLDAVSVSCRL